MKHLLLFLYMLSFWNGFAQTEKLDSLKNVYENANSKEHKIIALKNLCYEFSKSSNLDESQYYYDELIKKSGEINDKETLALAYQLLTREYVKKRDSVLALKYFLKSSKINIAIKNNLGLAKNYNDLGSLHSKYQQYEKAVLAYKKAINFSKQQDDIDILGTIYNNLGIAYQNQKDYLKAVEYFIEANTLAEKTSNSDLQARSLGSLGWNYIWLGQSDKADLYLKRALEIALKDNYVTEIINANRGLALSASRSGKFDEALSYNFIALELIDSYEDDLFKLDILLNIASTYSRMDNVKESLKTYEEASIIATELNTKEGQNTIDLNVAHLYLKEKKYDEAQLLLFKILKDTTDRKVFPEVLERSSYILLSMIYEAKNDYPKSLYYHKKYFRLAYDMLSKSQTESVTEIETKYQTEKKEKENLQLKAENAEKEIVLAQQTKRNWQLGGGLATAVMGLGIFFIAYRKNQKQKKEIEQQKDLVEALQKELHHRMKNNLAFIDLFINLAKGRFPDAAYQNKLTELQNRMRSMFEVHKQLFKKEDVTTVQAKNYIDTLVQNVQEAYAKDQNITIANKTSDDEMLLANTSFPIGLIVNEFVTNSYKYAFQDNEKGLIIIALSSDDKNYHLTLKDNGKGLPKDFNLDKLDSFGLETIQLLTREYKGTFNLDGSRGVLMNITLPKTAA
ncbi:MAG: tetratricopeptide repeat protein [Flavobacteriaceae bacterium]